MELIRECLFNFLVYSFMGWIIEGLFNLITSGSFLKSNFLILPIKPMYGFAGALLILLYTHVPWKLFLLFTFLVPTLIEYLSAVYLEHVFNLHYWDYSHKPYHINGYVCLQFSCYWIILSIILVRWIHPIIAHFYHWLLPVWPVSGFIMMLCVITDFIFTSLHYQGINRKST